mmetsp:Transcript_13989/g.25245  ORF Transcript_13989/g.25245 Transcript_13989/m.25245 type:complete len:154 (-) Transcript_13989:1079-1540(-)
MNLISNCASIPKFNTNMLILKNLGINDNEIYRLFDTGCFSLSLLSKISLKELLQIKGIGDQKISKIATTAKKLNCSGFKTIKRLLLLRQKQYHISSTDSRIDNILGGGFESGSVTELFGESKAGKTQFCHILCVSCLVVFFFKGLFELIRKFL